MDHKKFGVFSNLETSNYCLNNLRLGWPWMATTVMDLMVTTKEMVVVLATQMDGGGKPT